MKKYSKNLHERKIVLVVQSCCSQLKIMQAPVLSNSTDEKN